MPDDLPTRTWEISYRMPNGDTQWFRTSASVTFREAVMVALGRERCVPGGILERIEAVDAR